MRDRRRYQRLALNISVVIRIGGTIDKKASLGEEEIEVSALDISEGGIGLISAQTVPKGKIVEISMDFTTLSLEGEVVFHKPVSAEGEVRSVIPWEKDRFRLGIMFTKIDRENRIIIKEFVKRFMR